MGKSKNKNCNISERGKSVKVESEERRGLQIISKTPHSGTFHSSLKNFPPKTLSLRFLFSFQLKLKD